jgi:hypothetical protein
VGMESLGETLDVVLSQGLEAPMVLEALNRALPPGVKVLTAAILPGRLAPPQVEGELYQVASDEPVFEPQAAARFWAREAFPVTRRRPRETREIDLRHLVTRLTVTDACHLELELRRLAKDNFKAADTLAAIFSLDDGQTRGLRILKMRSV